MNKEKTKKLAIAAVAMVMAGSMAFSITACQPKDPGPGGDDTGDYEQGYAPKLDADGKLDYAEGTELRMNVGYYNSDQTKAARMTYNSSELTTKVTLPDGKDYSSGSLKPAWQAMQDELGVEFTDVFQNNSNEEQITLPKNDGTMNEYDLITSSAAAMTQNTDVLLNLEPYLDVMPNYKHFLDSNPALYYSLTSNTTNGDMYYAPYFDGFNDIEKYTLAEKTWLDDVLNASDEDLAAVTTTFAGQGAKKGSEVDATKASVRSYMGTTGSWEVDATDPDDVTKLVKAKVDYDAALAAAKSANGLGAAISAAKGSAYTGDSGNIVDIMNDVINATKGDVTGGELIKILQEYIDVAYTLGGEAYADRADVFNSVSAAWDVDLMVAAMRCVVASPALIGEAEANIGNLYGLAGRQPSTQRRTDLTAMAGELYGIRGMESRYEYLYIDDEGTIQDARLKAETFDLVDRMSEMVDEGLLYIGESNAQVARDTSKGPSPLFMHDYSQSQTTAGYTDETYNVSPIVNAVSRWDTDDDGSHETIMRFTESWRSVKNTGFCVSKAAVANNPDKLSAVLAFIDYLFSNDGQLIMTYGAQSTNGDTNPNGWWYADEATDVTLEQVAEQVEGSEQWTIKAEYETDYFVYKNTVYKSMVNYVRAIPKLTTANITLFEGGEVNGFKLDGVVTNQTASHNYTNYARYIMGATFPIGNKDQGFEYQCTAQCALDGAGIVSQALANGAIKHVTLSLAEGQSLWYMIAPTSLALDSNQQANLTNDEQSMFTTYYFKNSSDTKTQTRNVMIDIAFSGLGASGNYTNTNTAYHKTGAELTAWLVSAGLETRINIFRQAWEQTAIYFGII